MSRFLKILLWVAAILSIPFGFFIENGQIVFFGYRIPLGEAAFGVAGTLFLILLFRILVFVSFKKEDYYD